MPGFNKELSSELELLLNDAELRGSCLAAPSQSLYRALRGRMTKDRLVMPYPRAFARASYWKRLNKSQHARHILLAVHDLNPGWVFCGVSAALLHGLQVPYAAIDDKVHVAMSEKQHQRLNQHVRHHVYHGDKLCECGGITTTSLLCTTADCARMLGFRYGTAVADSALKVGAFSQEELLEYVESKRKGFRGVAQARKTSAFADARSANGGESVARAAMHELGFATPELQVEFPDPIEYGRSYFADFAWGLEPGTKVVTKEDQSSGLIIGELDGYDKYFDPVMNKGEGPSGALLRERRRESRLTITRAAVVRFSYSEVLDTAVFAHLLDTYGVPHDHDPLIAPPSMASPPFDDDRVPLELYGV